MPPELITFLAGAVPFLDVKLAVPLGRSLGLSSTSTLIFAISGAIIAPTIILILLDPFVKFLERRSKIIHKYAEKLLDKTRKEHSKYFKRFGAVFLIALIAIPVPGSGAGTGAIVAYLFGVDYWKAFTIIVIGTTASAMVMTLGLQSFKALAILIN